MEMFLDVIVERGNQFTPAQRMEEGVLLVFVVKFDGVNNETMIARVLANEIQMLSILLLVLW